MDHLSASSYTRVTNFQKCAVFIGPPCISARRGYPKHPASYGLVRRRQPSIDCQSYGGVIHHPTTQNVCQEGCHGGRHGIAVCASVIRRHVRPASVSSSDKHKQTAVRARGPLQSSGCTTTMVDTIRGSSCRSRLRSYSLSHHRLAQFIICA